MAENIYNAKKLTTELQAAKLPVESVSSTGEIVFQRDLTAKEKKTFKAVIAAHDPGQTDSEIERELISKAGITYTDMLMALWKKVVNDDSTEADALAQRIDASLVEMDA